MNREGFERVWNLVQEYFEGDIMDEARDPLSSDNRAGIDVKGRRAAEVPEQPVFKSAPAPGAGFGTMPELSPDQLNAVSGMLKQMRCDVNMCVCCGCVRRVCIRNLLHLASCLGYQRR